jgi:isoleucyl-tRNA synthetase/bisphosphoglycerate-dependent phosphoglycerate mutase
LCSFSVAKFALMLLPYRASRGTLYFVFDPVDPKQSFPALEHGILQYWAEEDIFKRSVKDRDSEAQSIWDKKLGEKMGKKDKKTENFSFYDGPPFATGLPHYGHLLAGTVKDVIPRYQSMRGKKVERRFGWDCHGLPVENLVEQENNIKDRKEIEEKGIEWFNNECRSSVQRYATQWRKTVERTGRWVDMDWDYKTMDPEYMESIWWVFKQLYEKGLIYEGYKSMHVCPRCVTPLSNFEVTLGYKDVTDESVISQFKLDGSNEYILAWTTTPWTLPGNVLLAVGEEIEYSKVKSDGKVFILAKALVEKIFDGKEYEIVESFPGKNLIGMKYEPLFPYFKDLGEKHFRVVQGNEFVTTEDGTGVVHIATGFGEDDYQTGKREGVDVLQHVAMDGKFVDEVTDFAGEDVKPVDNPGKTDKKVIDWLRDNEKLFDSQKFKHSYPYCWRCDSPLLNYATSSWFVAVEKIKEDIIKANKETEWVPKHVRDGRFGEWLNNSRDWAISRNRYWGTPLPIWRNGDDIQVIGSRDELMGVCPERFTKVTALRHGESEGNLIPIYQGECPGTDLTKKGKGQAKNAAKFISDSKIVPSVIYASPLARTQQTAGVIAKKIGAEVIVDERLREVNFGDWEKKTVDFSDLTFVKERRAHKMEKGKPESMYHFDGMETWDSVQDRVQDFFSEVLPKHKGEHIVVVTHADPAINIKHFFSKEDPVKLSHQPYPKKAEPKVYFWDHKRSAQMDLHRETVDDLLNINDGSVSADLTLVRHGETDWNKLNKIKGHEDIPLNEKGKEEAQKLAQQLKNKKYDVVISSDLSRASETAEIIAKELGIPHEHKLEILRERNIGSWTGRLMKDVLDEHPAIADEAYTVMLHHIVPDGAESVNSMFDRARKVCDFISDRYVGKKVIAVGHNGINRAIRVVNGEMSYKDALSVKQSTGGSIKLSVKSSLKRIPEVLDCWFESGSMPYAQAHFPFESNNADAKSLPKDFPADFISENLDQTRGWFYTLMVISTALFGKPAFWNCICGGMILAEDGKKMSKKLKNYPDPNELLERRGADALRFTLMSSPVVRAEEIKFSEKPVEETVRRVILPLWNVYSFFVLHANARFDTSSKKDQNNVILSEATSFASGEVEGRSSNPMDLWILAEVQDLVNRITKQLDEYDLSLACAEIYETLDALTNWYIRRSRRRFAGKEGEEERSAAISTLYSVLMTFSKVLAPFCPFITEAVYLNLTDKEHSSVHMEDWPETRKLSKEEKELLEKTRLIRSVVGLGMKLRAEQNIKVRQPLNKITIVLSANRLSLTDNDIKIISEELNVKNVEISNDASGIAEKAVEVNARTLGPRVGGRVQEIIKEAKSGKFTENKDGTITVMDEKLSLEEAKIIYRGKEGEAVASDRGIVVNLDIEITEDLRLEGMAREAIRAVQALRKEKGLGVNDQITLEAGEGMTEILEKFESYIADETNGEFAESSDGKIHVVVSSEGEKISVR